MRCFVAIVIAHFGYCADCEDSVKVNGEIEWKAV